MMRKFGPGNFSGKAKEEHENSPACLSMFAPALAYQRYDFVAGEVLEFVSTLPSSRTSCSILDLGCSAASLAKQLAVKLYLKPGTFNTSLRLFKIYYSGIDIDQEELDFARETLSKEHHCYSGRLEKSLVLNLYKGNFLKIPIFQFEDVEFLSIIEVIEHLDPPHLHQAGILFKFLLRGALAGKNKLKRFILTTPNHEFNKFMVGLSQGTFRHFDHRFEWTRQEFEAWILALLSEVAIEQFSDFILEEKRNTNLTWKVEFTGVGYLDHIPKEVSGPCTQIAVLTLIGEPAATWDPVFKPMMEACYYKLDFLSFEEQLKYNDLVFTSIRQYFDEQYGPSTIGEAFPAFFEDLLKLEALSGISDIKTLTSIIVKSKDLDISFDETFCFRFR